MSKACVRSSGQLVRLACLSLLFGGSVTLVVSVLSLIGAARAHGVPAIQGAIMAVPIFHGFGTLALISASLLLLAESLDYATQEGRPSQLTFARYLFSLLCAAASMILALWLIPSLEQLRPLITIQPGMYAQFHSLHHLARIVVSLIIALSFGSLFISNLQFQKDKT